MKEEEFKLKWKSYSSHLTQMLQDLMMNQSFTDVTLVCDDKIVFNAHMIVLSSSSGFFQRIFNNDSDSKPIVYLKGIEHQEIKAILDFIYLGEARVLKERYREFIKVAFDLELKAICKEGAKDDTVTKKENTNNKAFQYRNDVQEASTTIFDERSNSVNKENDIFDVVYLTEEQDERSGEFNAKSLIKIGLATKGNSSAKQLENVKHSESMEEDSDDKIEDVSNNEVVEEPTEVEPHKNDEIITEIENKSTTNSNNQIQKFDHTNLKEKGVKQTCVGVELFEQDIHVFTQSDTKISTFCNSNDTATSDSVESQENSSFGHYICDTCALMFNLKKQAMKHYYNCHHEKSNSASSYECNKCDKSFKYKSKLEEHWSVHSDEKLVCCTCGAKFQHQRHLTAHEKTHLVKTTVVERSYSCRNCDKAFKTKYDLNRHLVIHNKSATLDLLCNHCKRNFSRKDNLIKHTKKCNVE